MSQTFTAILWQEGHLWVARCEQVEDLASQGRSAEEALANLREATELWFETASPREVAERYHRGASVRQFVANA